MKCLDYLNPLPPTQPRERAMPQPLHAREPNSLRRPIPVRKSGPKVGTE